MLKRLIKMAEDGYLPDSLIRLGIKRLCKVRIDWAESVGPDAVEEHHQKWVDTLKQSPIALVPEKANEQHYEVPPKFFEYVLGSQLKYSSGFWPDGVTSLDQSEEKMLQLTCQRAELIDGQDILELGCGWGSLTCFMATLFPNSNITAVSNSKDQKKFILERCASSGITNVEIITADMNDFNINKVFDRVVSVEMFEHMRNYKTLLGRINSFLKDEGKLFIHIFSHRDLVYPFEDKGEGDWMAREFFSGGIMPSHHLLLYFQEDLKIESTWKLSGEHYQKTSLEWLKKIDQNKKKVLEIFKEVYGDENAWRWFQRWRIFFMSCEELFGFQNGTQWGVSHYRFIKREN
jgi:cyclopropane-fatty-acyl-phospholipid synthase|tara:strand:- start:7828 stop:8868 length:1041 start_codon:yes stop_codon:yes gene_type:complete